MENILDLIIRIITLVIIGIEIIFLVWTYVATKLKQAKQETGKDVLLKESLTRNKIFELIPQFVNQAEKIFGVVPKTGASKLLYVMQELRNYCQARNLDLDEDEATAYIETVLETPTKKVLTDDCESDITEEKEQSDNGQIGSITENF